MAKKATTTTPRAPSKPKKGRKRTTRGLLGGKLTIKSVAIGTAALVAMKRLQPFGGIYKPALDKIASGLALGAVKMDNSDLVTSGVKEALSILVDGFLGGNLGFQGIGEQGGDSL